MPVTDRPHTGGVSRWEPDGRRRLQEAAFELFVERGFAQTTAAAIAERAGLTAVAGAPPEAATLDVILAGLTAIAGEMQPRRPQVLQRDLSALVA
jgi:Bacterial regulatory proteins, tetR family